MSIALDKEKLYDGIDYISITDERFKTNFIAVQLITELSSETASENALIISILSKNNAKYPTITEFNKKLTSLYGANINGDVTKLGDSHGLLLSMSCIADKYALNNEKISAEATDILLDCLLRPNLSGGAFEPKDFALSKQELIDDIDAIINEKRSYAVMRASKVCFSGEAASVSVYGEREEADAITPMSAYEQYKKLLKTAKIMVVFAGCENCNEVKEKFRNAFSAVDRDFSADYTSAKSVVKASTEYVTEKLDVLQSKMVMAFKSDEENPQAMRLMNAVFGATPFSKLFNNVREKMSLCYYCSSSYQETKGVLFVDSGVEHENIDKACAEIQNQLKEIAEGRFTDEEVDNSLLSIINSEKSVNDSPYALASWYTKQEYIGSRLSPEEDIEKLRAVTRDDIIRAAKSCVPDTVYVLTKKEEN